MIIEEKSTADWIYISFLPEKAVEGTSSSSVRGLDGKISTYGYVPAKRIRRLPPPEEDFMTNVDDGSSRFLAKDSLLIYMDIGRLLPTDTWSKDTDWGVDVGAPQSKIYTAYLEVKDQRYNLNTKNFYEPDFMTTSLIYDQQMKNFIITMSNSKGEGHYISLWQIAMNGDIRRYVFRN